MPVTRSSASRTSRALGAAPDEAEPLEPAQAGQADVLADRPAQDQAVVLARLGDERDTGLDRGGRAGRQGGAADLDAARRRRGWPRRWRAPAPSARRR